MGSRVVVVQHGEKVREPGDPGLTEQDRQQALATARYVLDRFAPSEVWASPPLIVTFLPARGDSSERAVTRFLDALTQIAEDGVPCGAVMILERADAAWRLVQLPSVEHLDRSVEHRPA